MMLVRVSGYTGADAHYVSLRETINQELGIMSVEVFTCLQEPERCAGASHFPGRQYNTTGLPESLRGIANHTGRVWKRREMTRPPCSSPTSFAPVV